MADKVDGRIKKIKVRNFMTYDRVELYPKKGLNLIVGLNGSGKSSIMCAISLGLGGKANSTGRAKSNSEFIKYGCTEAEIEIELEKENGNLFIQRKLRPDKCEWKLNHSVSNQVEVVNAVKECNIDTSNLCQFLPQEKVTEFSKMDKRQRLENMLTTIGEPYLYELFNELKALKRQTDDVEQDRKRSQEKKNAAVEQNERIYGEFKKQEDRDRDKRDLNDLYDKRKILEYNNLQREVSRLKTEKKEMETKLATLKEEQRSAVNAENSILESYGAFSQQKQQFNSEKRRIVSNITIASNNLKTLKEEAEKTNIEYTNRLIEVEDEKKRLHDLNAQIDGLKQRLEEEEKYVQKHKEQDEVHSQNLFELHLESARLFKQRETIKQNENRINYAIQNCQQKLSALQDENNKKMNNLKRRDKASYEAAQWLLENRHTFISNIYLPIMLEIKVHRPADCKYVENSIPFRDMIAFVCENESDYERFTDIAAQRKWPINVVMPPDTPLNQLSSSPLENSYKSAGLQCYVSDLFTAPEPILKYLFSIYKIHRVPVAPVPVSGQNVNFILQKYRTFFSGDFKITGKVSKYGNRNMSTTKDSITKKDLLVIQNQDSENDFLKELQDLKEKKLLIEQERQELECKGRELESKEAKVRQEKKHFLDFQKSLKKQKDIYNQKVRSRDRISCIDIEEEKQKMIRKIQSINETRRKTLEEMNQLFKVFVHIEKEIIKVIFSMNSLSVHLKLTRAENEDIHDNVKITEEAFQNLKNMYYEKKRTGTILYKEVLALGQSKINRAMNCNSEDIEQRINDIKAKLSMDEDNQPIISDYKARTKQIEDYKNDIKSLEDRLKKIKEDIEGKKTEWIIPLQGHIENINKKFSHYFKLLNCAGEINLDIPDNPNDFAKYGLQIRLKFRDEEPFTELSQSRHSGGECSVAAVVFILSLQELLDVPFRCIDEINQGMDSINERKVYQLIADCVEDDRCSQYFLLTPKLLPDLELDDVAVHIIFNSSFINMKLDVKEHLRLSQLCN